MSGGGSKPGERRGGRQKGTKDKKVVAEEARKIALLATVKDIFEEKGYGPLDLAVDIALQSKLGKDDYIFFQMHMALAKKYYSDLGALKVDATVEHKPITVVERQFKVETNGHARSPDAV